MYRPRNTIRLYLREDDDPESDEAYRILVEADIDFVLGSSLSDCQDELPFLVANCTRFCHLSGIEYFIQTYREEVDQLVEEVSTFLANQ